MLIDTATAKGSENRFENQLANHRARKYTRLENLLRVFWFFGLVVFQLSPRPFFSFRRNLLKLFGARIGRGVRTYPSTHIYLPWNLSIGNFSSLGEHVLIYNLGIVAIGERVTISQRAHLCAGSHDYSDPTMPLLKPPIVIEDGVWICTDAFVGPGVTIRSNAIVAACTVVVKEVAANEIVGGNPAKFIKYRDGR